MRHVLLDTQVFLWMQFEPGKLSAKLRELLRDEDKEISISLFDFRIKRLLKPPDSYF